MEHHKRGELYIQSVNERNWYLGVEEGALADAKAENINSELSREQQIFDVNEAFYAYARAKRLANKADKYWTNIERSHKDRFGAEEERKWRAKLK